MEFPNMRLKEVEEAAEEEEEKAKSIQVLAFLE